MPELPEVETIKRELEKGVVDGRSRQFALLSYLQ